MVRILLISFISLFLTVGCGGGGSGSGSGSNPSTPLTDSVQGTVSHSVKDAKVEILNSNGQIASFCGDHGRLLCTVWTDDWGNFIFRIPTGTDLSGHSLITHSGEDTTYGLDLSHISLRTSFDFYSRGSGGYSGVTVSPVTTLALMDGKVAGLQNHGFSNTDSGLKLKKIFDIDDNVSLLDAPESNDSLLKASYIIIKAAVLRSEEKLDEEPMGKFAELLKSYSENDSLDDIVNGLYDSDDSKNQLREVITAVVALDPEDGPLVFQIQKKERLRMVGYALSGLLEGISANSSDSNYISSLAYLCEKLNVTLNGIPMNQLAINQLIRYIAYKDSFFATYNSYLNIESFKTSLDSFMVNEADTLKYLASMRVYNVSVPLKEPLGMDNKKRINYYLNSNVDYNYKAIRLLDRVKNDKINDKIYGYAIISYAKFGLHEKAGMMAKNHIIDPIVRVKMYTQIAKHISKTSREASMYYAGEAESLLLSLKSGAFSNEVIARDYADAYQMLANAYNFAGMKDDAMRIRSYVANDLINSLSALGEAAKRKVMGNIITGQGRLVESLIEEGHFSDALEANDFYVDLIELLPPNPKPNFMYAVHVLQYGNALNYYRLTSNNANIDDNKNKIRAVFEKAAGLTNAPGFDKYWQGQAVYGNYAETIAWALGVDVAENEIVNRQKNNAIGQRCSIMKITFYKAKHESFENAVSYYEGKVKLKEDYSDISVVFGYIHTFSYYGDKNLGLAEIALKEGKDDLADKSIDYIYGKLNEAVQYAVDANKDISDMVIGVPSSIIDNRYKKDGYLKIADLYIRTGKAYKAGEVLEVAANYVNSLNDSFRKSKSFAAIAFYMNAAGFDSRADQLFDLASGVNFSGDSKLMSDHYVGLARDAAVSSRSWQEKASLADRYLADAKYHAELINDFRDQASAYRLIAEEYAGIRDDKKALESYGDSLISAGKIAVDKSRLGAYKSIFESFGKNGYADEAFVRINSLNVTLADRNNLIEALAEKLSQRNDLGLSEIAFVDTDRDGRPDFFLPWVTPEQIAASGLVLDDDIDGDGITDDIDMRPYVSDRN